MTTSPTLTLSKLGCIKGGRQLFKDLDCTLQAGHWLYVAGANGVGKTSLLRMICGLAQVESGQILWNDLPITAQHDSYRQDLCYLGHLNALQESMSVQENLMFTSALGGVALDAPKARAVLERFGLRGRSQQLVRHLSQGQKRRVALSRLALSPARLWVLDEPYVAMDEAGIQMLSNLIAAHLDKGGLAVLTSHQRVPVGSHPAQLLELKAA
ncbi:cytochrome c biogenesis heme-transporting ATPase CcmA [Rhodoferax sp. 4810]|nr:cytochrome c biogenesis heme-transporting ATPase CcmA [Rhodoferax jenense]